MTMKVGFETCDLSDATVTGEDLCPLQFDRTNYTPFEEFIHRLDHLPEKPRRVYNYALGVHGRVSSDWMKTYLATEGESSSLLKEALKSPRHYLIARNEEIKPREAKHFELGTFAHEAILEPRRFEKVVVKPKADRGTIRGCIELINFYCDLLQTDRPDIMGPSCKLPTLKALASDMEEKAVKSGYTMIDQTHCDIIRAMKISFNTYGGGILPKIMPYIKTETSMYGKDSSTGLKVKIRPDGMLLEENFGINAILSVKTTNATSVEAFMRDCAKYRYELAEGMYLKVASDITGRTFTATVMIMAQTVIPFQVAVFYWNAEDLEVGKYKYAQAMDIVKQCRETDFWPGFDAKAEEGAHGIIQCKLPEYIKAELLPQYLPNNQN